MCIHSDQFATREKKKTCVDRNFPFYLLPLVFTLLAVEISQRPGFISSFVFLNWRYASARTTHSAALQMLFIFSLGDCVFFRAARLSHLFFCWLSVLVATKIASAQSTALNEHILSRAATVHSTLNFFATIFLFHSIQSIYRVCARVRIWNKNASQPKSTSRWEVAGRAFSIALVFLCCVVMDNFIHTIVHVAFFPIARQPKLVHYEVQNTIRLEIGNIQRKKKWMKLRKEDLPEFHWKYVFECRRSIQNGHNSY